MTTSELLTRCNAEWHRLRAVPIHLRDAEWTMRARNLDYQTAEAMQAAVDEPMAEEKTPAPLRHVPGIASVCDPSVRFCAVCGLVADDSRCPEAVDDLGSCDACEKVFDRQDLFNAAGGGLVCGGCRC